jgi:hypothetical protein
MPNYEYALSYYEEATCAHMGYMRQRRFFGKPDKNINYCEGDIQEMWQHAICAGAELAFARMIGLLNFVPSVDTFKTQFDIQGIAEVRYTFNEHLGMRFTDKDFKQVRYVLMADGLRHKSKRVSPLYLGTPYRAIGWLWGTEVFALAHEKYPNSYYVERELLNPMESFELD